MRIKTYNPKDFELYQKIGITALLVVLTGVFGWIYEFIFYFFNGGMTDFFLQGGNFLPWINIYATGSLLILFATRRVRNKPVAIFLISILVTGILEYISGWMIYNSMNGLRLWDYDAEILNFGNIDGFICLRSVLFFGFSALFLIYVLLPFLITLSKTLKKRTFLTLSLILCGIFLADELYNLIAAHILNIPSAVEVYKSLGFKYVE